MKNYILFMTALAAGTVFGAVAITGGETSVGYTRPDGFPKSLSGITYAGGDTYYVVADDNDTAEVGLYKVTIKPNGTSKWSSASIGSRISLTMATDLEAVAYDPASGHIWAANETTTKTIKEYDPVTGAQLSTLTIPPVMLKDRSNYGFESLTISGDGLTMWTANEESLTVDGPRSSMSAASTNRLVKFTREAPGKPWRLAAMYPYVTDKWHNLYNLGGSGRRGIADLCALPDGSLLVLERELSSSSDGTGISAKWNADFYIAIYRLTPEALAAATDVKDFDGLANGGWTKVAKGSSLVPTGARGYKNWEGFCLGQRLSDGSCFMPMLTDAGDGNTSALLACMGLSGLDIRTLDFTAPDSGDVPSVVGTNYRYLSGAEVSVTLSGEGLAPTAYTNNGARVASASWSTTSGKSGTGATATFTVTGDDTLSWTVASSVAQTPIVGSDTFEEYAIWTDSTAIAGWTDGGMVNEGTPTPPSVGYPMQRATHAKVLAVDGSISRDYASSAETRQQIDAMVKVVLPEEDVALPVAGYQCGVVMSASGKALVVYAAPDGSVTNAVASERTFKSGDWVRVTLAFDYTSEPTFSLRLDGAPCGTFPCVGGKRRVSGFDVRGNTALDDVIFTDGVPDFEIAADPSSTVPAGVKVPSAWFDRYGLAWNDTESDADGDKLINWKEYLAGTAPDDGESVFEMTGFKVEGNDVEVTFSGELPRPDLLRLKWCAELGGGETAVGGTVTAEGGVSVWRATVPDEARFFRAYIDAAK